MKQNSGFTLTELMITVAILIILAAIAVPNYRGHVLRSQRSEAMGALLRISAAQEKFYLQNNTYTDKLGTDGLNTGIISANDHYNLSVRSADVQGFQAEAVAAGGQAADSKCALYRINQEGQKLARDGDGNDTTDTCWR